MRDNSAHVTVGWRVQRSRLSELPNAPNKYHHGRSVHGRRLAFARRKMSLAVMPGLFGHDTPVGTSARGFLPMAFKSAFDIPSLPLCSCKMALAQVSLLPSELLSTTRATDNQIFSARRTSFACERWMDRQTFIASSSLPLPFISVHSAQLYPLGLLSASVLSIVFPVRQH